ncbi:hypothetical protein [Solirubrobacter deserti]|uniref:Cardiolipin synthase N-terminal domain-containing protein n=1 Tax=Solirubrobacter deserti TaxID=2282478 RepID=A0ABT4RJY2_9ACTN|nr:hypothetical protein [Solirubrobacter deserti]MDA0138866.1 hypothetical protein [Solirubrobacter deserti]
MARVLTLAVALGALAYMLLWVRAFGLPRPAFIDPEGLASFGITLAVIVAVWGTIGLFVWDVFSNPRLGDAGRIAWSVALVVLHVLAMLAYWALYLSRQRE